MEREVTSRHAIDCDRRVGGAAADSRPKVAGEPENHQNSMCGRKILASAASFVRAWSSTQARLWERNIFGGARTAPRGQAPNREGVGSQAQESSREPRLAKGRSRRCQIARLYSHWNRQRCPPQIGRASCRERV